MSRDRERLIRKLRGKRWRWLHKLVYPAAVCGLIHRSSRRLEPAADDRRGWGFFCSRGLCSLVQRRKAAQITA
jgi:hypothetical protein